jgi:hypothetical protein
MPTPAKGELLGLHIHSAHLDEMHAFLYKRTHTASDQLID